VFDFLFDFARAASWRSYVRRMEQVDPGPARAGTRIRSTMELQGAERELEIILTAVERPRLWRHTTNEIDFRGEVEYALQPEKLGTRVTMTGAAKPVTIYGWLALPLLWLHRGKGYREQLPRLKAVLERNP
jgi:hypothetical protein